MKLLIFLGLWLCVCVTAFAHQNPEFDPPRFAISTESDGDAEDKTDFTTFPEDLTPAQVGIVLQQAAQQNVPVVISSDHQPIIDEAVLAASQRDSKTAPVIVFPLGELNPDPGAPLEELDPIPQQLESDRTEYKGRLEAMANWIRRVPRDTYNYGRQHPYTTVVTIGCLAGNLYIWIHSSHMPIPSALMVWAAKILQEVVFFNKGTWPSWAAQIRDKVFFPVLRKMGVSESKLNSEGGKAAGSYGGSVALNNLWMIPATVLLNWGHLDSPLPWVMNVIGGSAYTFSGIGWELLETALRTDQNNSPEHIRIKHSMDNRKIYYTAMFNGAAVLDPFSLGWWSNITLVGDGIEGMGRYGFYRYKKWFASQPLIARVRETLDPAGRIVSSFLESFHPKNLDLGKRWKPSVINHTYSTCSL